MCVCVTILASFVNCLIIICENNVLIRQKMSNYVILCPNILHFCISCKIKFLDNLKNESQRLI